MEQHVKLIVLVVINVFVEMDLKDVIVKVTQMKVIVQNNEYSLKITRMFYH